MVDTSPVATVSLRNEVRIKYAGSEECFFLKYTYSYKNYFLIKNIFLFQKIELQLVKIKGFSNHEFSKERKREREGDARRE